MSDRTVAVVIEQIRKKPDSTIGPTTGSTPKGLYQRLIETHRERGLDFSKLITFDLFEYMGLPPEHEQSYAHYMWSNLFDHVNVNPSRVHIPHGTAEDVDEHCRWCEWRIEETGGIDLQILGIGANGHIAFNEPGSSLGSHTRIKTLTSKTVGDNARFSTVQTWFRNTRLRWAWA